MKKKNTVKIEFDIVKEAKKASRNFFKDKPSGNFAHRDKTKYSRKKQTKIDGRP